MNDLPKTLRIGVVRGGPGPEYEISLQTGAHVLKHLGETHVPVDIFISKDGKWHINGIERSPEKILKNVDVVWNALHGTFGEDGQIQDILKHLGAKYTGSERLPSAISINKWMTKERTQTLGIKTPVSMLVRQTDSLSTKAKEIFNTMPHPLIVKPASSGSFLHVYKVDSFSELLSSLETVLLDYSMAIVEDYIPGKLATIGVIDDFRGQELYTLPPVEIILEGNREVVPGNFSQQEKSEIERVAKLIHKELGLRHYSSSDFIVSPRRGVYFLEANTSPKLTKKSHSPEVLGSVGVSVKEFLHHILNLAIYETGIWL